MHEQLKKAKENLYKMEENLKQARTYYQRAVYDCEIIENAIIEEMLDSGVTGELIDGYRYSLTNPKGQVKIDDIESIPDEFIRIKKEADKIAIKKHLENSQCNWASIEIPKPKLKVEKIKHD